MANFTVATTEKYKGKDGNMVAETEWHNVAVWGRLADVVDKYVTKGTQVYVEGKIKSEKYTDKEGNEKYATRILASSLQLLGKKEGASQQAAPAPAQKVQYKSTPIVAGDPQDDDLPFN